MTRERDQHPVQGPMAQPRLRLDPDHQDMRTGREVHHGDGPPRRLYQAPEREPVPRRQRVAKFKCGRSSGSSAQNWSIWRHGHD